MRDTLKLFAHRTSLLCALLVLASLALAGSIDCHPASEARDTGRFRSAAYAHMEEKFVPNDIDGLVEFLSHIYTGETVDMGDESTAWIAHIRLSKLLDRETALELLHHPIATVRVWVARIILERFPEDREQVLPLLQDQSSVHTERGCITLEDDVALLVKELLYEFDYKASHPQDAPNASPP